jgi:hypothetical protein
MVRAANVKALSPMVTIWLVATNHPFDFPEPALK